MYIYYLLFLVPALFSFLRSNFKWSLNISVIISSIYIFFLGLRDEIGVDWNQYIVLIGRYSSKSYAQQFLKADPIYFSLNKFFENYEGAIYYVNFVCAFYCFLNDLQTWFGNIVLI